MERLSNVAQYIVLAAVMRRRAQNGIPKPGDRVPGEAVPYSANGVGRGTAVTAIKKLATKGIAHRRQGFGSLFDGSSLHRRVPELVSAFAQARNREVGA